MNGKPGDHPITDLMVHHIAVLVSHSIHTFVSSASSCLIIVFATGFSSTGPLLQSSYSHLSQQSWRSCDATRKSEVGRTCRDTQFVATSSSSQALQLTPKALFSLGCIPRV